MTTSMTVTLPRRCWTQAIPKGTWLLVEEDHGAEAGAGAVAVAAPEVAVVLARHRHRGRPRGKQVLQVAAPEQGDLLPPQVPVLALGEVRLAPQRPLQPQPKPPAQALGEGRAAWHLLLAPPVGQVQVAAAAAPVLAEGGAALPPHDPLGLMTTCQASFVAIRTRCLISLATRWTD